MDKTPQPKSHHRSTDRQESTATMLSLVREGDKPARERLVARYLPILRQWARGRVPQNALGMSDTDDLVQVTLLKALDRVGEFEPRREGAFLAYLRKILQNQIRDQIRHVNRRPKIEELTESLAESGPSPLEEAIGKDVLESYEQALLELPDKQREAVILRLELGLTHQEVADAIGSDSWNAARMLVARALVRMAELMDEQRQ